MAHLMDTDRIQGPIRGYFYYSDRYGGLGNSSALLKLVGYALDIDNLFKRFSRPSS